MQDTKENSSKLNPEIKEKAGELFNLIEKQLIKDKKTTKTRADISKAMGDMLRSHRGMIELSYAYEMSLTKSQMAKYDLEMATCFMSDKALKPFMI